MRPYFLCISLCTAGLAYLNPKPAFASGALKACTSELVSSVVDASWATTQPLLLKAPKPVGLAIGIGNSMIKLTCGVSMLPPAIEPWLPLSNEIANVLSTSTGAKWIYSGMSKELADGIGLGSIIGQTTLATAVHGPVGGGITLAANLTFSYWFPNTYLHTILHSAPELVPGQLKYIRSAVGSPVGQGVIGISIIVIIEHILHYANHLSETAPNPFKVTESKPALDTETDARLSTAAMIVDNLISDNLTTAPTNEQQKSHQYLLRYLVGNSGDGKLFSTLTDPPTGGASSIKLTDGEKARLIQLAPQDLQKKLALLLSPEQLQALLKRVSWAKTYLTQ